MIALRTVKRARGRPRKDASKEIFAAPLDEQTKKALTEEWRSTMDSSAANASSAAKAELLVTADLSSPNSAGAIVETNQR